MTIEPKGGGSTLKETHTEMTTRPIQVLEGWLDEDGELDANGKKAHTHALVQSLISCIHSNHAGGHWDSADHYRYILKELERGFLYPDFEVIE